MSKNAAGKAVGSNILNCLGTIGSVSPTNNRATAVLAATGKHTGATGTIRARSLSEVKTKVLVTLRG